MSDCVLDWVTINGVEYVRKGVTPATPGLPAVIVRTRSAGAHFGYLVSREGTDVKLERSRRLWYWKCKAGIALSGVAAHGLAAGCKVDSPVTIVLTEAIEVINCSEASVATIEAYT